MRKKLVKDVSILNEQQDDERYVILRDIQIPFSTMVKILVMSTLASIPAFIILGFISGIVVLVLGTFGFFLGSF
jgi:hypothetical protein